jgi:hypothetical protein
MVNAKITGISAAALASRTVHERLAVFPAITGTAFGTSIASLLAMTDENYTALLLWTICVLTFACGVVALTQHPEWFGA